VMIIARRKRRTVRRPWCPGSHHPNAGGSGGSVPRLPCGSTWESQHMRRERIGTAPQRGDEQPTASQCRGYVGAPPGVAVPGPYHSMGSEQATAVSNRSPST
jgi:hypothetical protein